MHVSHAFRSESHTHVFPHKCHAVIIPRTIKLLTEFYFMKHIPTMLFIGIWKSIINPLPLRLTSWETEDSKRGRYHGGLKDTGTDEVFFI